MCVCVCVYAYIYIYIYYYYYYCYFYYYCYYYYLFSLCIYMCVCVRVHVCVCLFIYLSTYLSINPSIHPFMKTIYPSIQASIYLRLWKLANMIDSKWFDPSPSGEMGIPPPVSSNMVWKKNNNYSSMISHMLEDIGIGCAIGVIWLQHAITMVSSPPEEKWAPTLSMVKHLQWENPSIYDFIN